MVEQRQTRLVHDNIKTNDLCRHSLFFLLLLFSFSFIYIRMISCLSFFFQLADNTVSHVYSSFLLFFVNIRRQSERRSIYSSNIVVQFSLHRLTLTKEISKGFCSWFIY